MDARRWLIFGILFVLAATVIYMIVTIATAPRP